MILKVKLIVCQLLFLYLIAFSQIKEAHNNKRNDLYHNVGGSNGVLKYNKQQGVIYLDDSTILRGEIKMKSNGTLTLRKGKDKGILINMQNIDSMILKGAEKNKVMFRTDSTVFKSILYKNEKILCRQLVNGRVLLYDWTYVIDEGNSDALNGMDFLIYNDELGWNAIHELKEIIPYFPKDTILPMFLKVLDIESSNYSSFMAYVCHLFNLHDKKELFDFPEIIVKLTSGEVIKGTGLVGPHGLSSLNTKEKNDFVYAMVLVKNNLKIYYLKQIESVQSCGLNFKPYYHKGIDKDLLVAKWDNNGEPYYILLRKNSYAIDIFKLPTSINIDGYIIFRRNENGNLIKKIAPILYNQLKKDESLSLYPYH